MQRSSKSLVALAFACLAVALSAIALFNWYLRRSDEKLKEKWVSLAPAYDQPTLPEVKVAIPKDLRSDLEAPDRFQITYRVSDIPDSVKAAFAKATEKSTQEPVFSMAEPKAWPWNVGDAIREGLPRRRLKAVAASESLYLIFYEHGGFGTSDDVGAFRVSGGEGHAIWHSCISGDVTNVIKLRDAIRGESYGDESY